MSTTAWVHRDGTPYTGRPEALTVGARGVSARYSQQGRCGRCGGAGGSDAWVRTGWTCYECGGDGRGPVRTVPVYTPAKAEQLNAAQAKREAKRQAEAEAARAAEQAEADTARTLFLAAHPTVAADLDTLNGNGFAASLRDALTRYGQLTDRQLSALADAAERERRPGQLWGAEGQRATVTVTVERVTSCGFDSYRGAERYLVALLTDDGAALVWFTTNPPPELVAWNGEGYPSPQAGPVAIRATVRSHGTYQGKPQTVVTRVATETPAAQETRP